VLATQVIYCKTPFFRCILILRFSYVENSLHFNLADFYHQNSYGIIVYILQRIRHISYHITELLTFYADKLLVMDNSKNSRVFNFTILFRSRKFDAREIYTFYSIMSAALFN